MPTSADEWWDCLPEERKNQIMGWLDRTPGMVYSPDQLTILDEEEEPHDESVNDV
ncbi:MAG: hypothetical protein SPK00_03305 [Corynebacterium glucuronolyticum]|nr:hypothetical protein [Mycobacteriaceae bacterium]MDY5833764.1 hypothetical protein [Corynebacterium glucuronolyticum]